MKLLNIHLEKDNKIGGVNLTATTSLCKKMHIFDMAQPHPYDGYLRTRLNELLKLE